MASISTSSARFFPSTVSMRPRRALEVEIEAINNGILPQGAFDSLDAARFLQDNEEYWPFEGDDWPDEFVGEK
jgi:hypothetical protein